MTLFPDEAILFQPKGTEVTLTTHRIWEQKKESHKSIMIEHITSCETKAKSYWLLWGIGVICFGLGLYILTVSNGRMSGF